MTNINLDLLEQARARLRTAQTPQPVTGFTSTPVQPQEEEGGSFLGGIAEGFRGFVPQGVRDVGGSILQGAGRVLEEADRPLSERIGFRLPEAPGPFDEIANFALEEFTRPTNLAIAFGGAGVAARGAASGSRAIRLASGLARPVVSGSPQVRVAGEAALSGGARLAAEEAEKRDAPAPIRLIAPLLGGVVGLGVGRGAAAALSRQRAARLIEAEIPDLGTQFAHPLPDFAAVRGTVETLPEGPVRAIMEKVDPIFAINPSVLQQSDIGKNYIAFMRQVGRAEQLGELAVGASLDPFNARVSGAVAAGPRGRLFDIREGRIANLPTGQPVAWNDVFSDPQAVTKYRLTGEQGEFISTFRQVVEETEQIRRLHGLKPREFSRDDWLFVPRSARGVGERSFRRPSNPNLQRVFELAEEGIAKGVDYEDPRNTLLLHVQAAYQEVAEKQFSDAMEQLAVTPKAVLRGTNPGVISRYEGSIKSLRSAQSDLRAAIRQRAAARAGGGTATLRRFVGDARQEATAIGIPDDLVNRFIRLSRRTMAAEKAIDDTGRALMDEMRREGKDPLGRQWREFSKRRGYTPREIAEYDRYRQLARRVLDSGVRIDDLHAFEETTLRGGLQDIGRTREQLLAVSRQQVAKADVAIKTAERRVSDVRAAKEKARVAYKNALDQAKQKEYAPGFLFGHTEDELIPVAKWKGRFLPRDEDYQKLADRMDVITGRQRRDSVNLLARGARELTDTVRFWASVGDFAAPFIQGLPLLGRNPVAWSKMMRAQYEAFFNPRVQANYLSQNVDTVRRMAQAGVPLGEVELFSAVERQGSLLNQMVRRTGVTGAVEAVPVVRNVNLVGRLMAGYNHSLLVARTELWKSLEGRMTSEELARYVRNMTGALDSRALGVSPSRRAAEGMWLAFSPRLLRSTVALIADAARPETAVGREAARALLGLAGVATSFYMLSGIAMGKSMEELEEGLNPLNGRRFLGHQVNGDWVGIGGQVRAMTQFVAKAVANPEGFATADQWENPLINFYMSRGAPAVNIVGGALEAATDEKVDVLPFENIDSFPNLLAHIGTSAIPFSIQGQLEGEQSSTLAFAISGFRTSPETATDALDDIAQQRFGQDYSDLLPVQQQEIERDRPDLIEKRRQFGAREQRIFSAKQEEITTERLQGEGEIAAAFQSGRLSAQQMGEALENLQFGAAQRREQVQRDFGREFETDDPRRQALDAWFQTFREAEVVPGSGVIEWDLRDRLEQDLFARITPEQREYIEQRRVTQHAPEVQFYYDAKTTISESGYYDVQDEVYERFAPQVGRVLGRTPESYGDFIVAQNIALRGGDVRTVRLLKTIQGRIDREVQQRRERLRIRNRDLNAALIAIGRVSATSELALRLR